MEGASVLDECMELARARARRGHCGRIHITITRQKWERLLAELRARSRTGEGVGVFAGAPDPAAVNITTPFGPVRVRPTSLRAV